MTSHISSRRTSGRKTSSSGGSMHFYEYEYEYEIKNTSYRAALSSGLQSMSGSLKNGSFSALPDKDGNKIKIFGYGINLI